MYIIGRNETGNYMFISTSLFRDFSLIRRRALCMPYYFVFREIFPENQYTLLFHNNNFVRTLASDFAKS